MKNKKEVINTNISTNLNHKSIKDWREDERPRERLYHLGSNILSDAEILAILIGSGTKHCSALDIAKALLDRYGSLERLSNCDISELKQVRGMGFAKSITLAAAFEIGKRVKSEPFALKGIIRSPTDVVNYYIERLRGLKNETFRIVLLTSSNTIIREAIISTGTLNASLVHPREVFRLAITESSASIILIHNHPSGNCEPSKEDLKITKQLVEAGKIVDIKVLDHIIIGGENYSSFVQLGLIV